MHLGDDDIFIAVDALDDTLAASRAVLEAIAAAHLPFQAQLRIQKASTRQARAWLKANASGLVTSRSAEVASLLALAGGTPDETDEILKHTLGLQGSPFDDGPEGADDAMGVVEGLDLQGGIDDDDLVDVDSLVQFTDDDEDLVAVEIDVETLDLDGDADALVSFTEDDAESVEIDDEQLDDEDSADFIEVDEDIDEEDDSARYVVFEESVDDGPTEVLVGLDDGAGELGQDVLLGGGGFGDGDDLESASDPDSAADAAELSEFDDVDDLVTLGGDESDFDLDEEVGGTISPDHDGPDQDGDGSDGALTDVEAVQSDSTLVTDLESLVRLQDMLAEDAASGAAHGGEEEQHRPDPRATDPVRVTTTLTDDDLDRLGFASTDQLIAPDGADADPNSESGVRPSIRMATPPAAPDPTATQTPPGVRGKSADGAGYSNPRGASVALGASLPTIRDQQPGQSRPSAAAIRIDPSGGGRAVAPEQEEALALGGAPDDDDEYEQEDYGDGSFSLDVEEYELVEEEEEAEDSEASQDEPEAPPAPMPTLSADQETHLLRQAVAAYTRGELPVAADLYSDVLDFNPDNGQAALGRGRVYLDLGDYARAMSDFTVAEDIIADDPDVHAAMGELYYARKDYQRAIDYFDQALERNDRHAMAWCRRGIAHYYRKDYEQAYKDLVKAQKLDDSIPNIRTYIGMVKKKRR